MSRYVRTQKHAARDWAADVDLPPKQAMAATEIPSWLKPDPAMMEAFAKAVSEKEASTRLIPTGKAERDLKPLLLFRGGWSLGRVQALWNFVQILKAANVPTLRAAADVSYVFPGIRHISGLHRAIGQGDPLLALHSRMQSAPTTQRVDPELWDYLRSLIRTTNSWRAWLKLEPISETSIWSKRKWRRPEHTFKYQICGTVQRYNRAKCRCERCTAAWRDYIAGTRGSTYHPSVGAPLPEVWPFISEDAAITTDRGYALLAAVDEAVPKGLPEQYRQDVCQDVLLELLQDELKPEELSTSIGRHIARIFKQYPIKYGPLSLDAPPPWDSEGRTLLETLTADDLTYA